MFFVVFVFFIDKDIVRKLKKKILVCWLNFIYNVCMEDFDINFVEERVDSFMY